MNKDKELENLRKKRLSDIEADSKTQQNQEEIAKAQDEQYRARKQMMLRKILTPEARIRLSNLRMAKPDIVNQIEDQLIALAGSGRISKIDDKKLKQLLRKLVPKKREINIERK